MIDLAVLYRGLMNADNMAFVEQIKKTQEKEKQELKAQERKKQELKAQAYCQCGGGGFAYCEVCHAK